MCNFQTRFVGHAQYHCKQYGVALLPASLSRIIARAGDGSKRGKCSLLTLECHLALMLFKVVRQYHKHRSWRGWSEDFAAQLGTRHDSNHNSSFDQWFSRLFVAWLSLDLRWAPGTHSEASRSNLIAWSDAMNSSKKEPST